MRPVSCDKNCDKVPVTPMKQTGQLEEEEEPEEEEYSSIIMIDSEQCPGRARPLFNKVAAW